MRQRPAHGAGHQRCQKARQQTHARQLDALHLAQERAARAHRAHDGVLTGPVFAGRADGGKQHDQPSRQREHKQKLDGGNHLVQHFLQLGNRAAHVGGGDIGKLAHQRVVKAAHGRRFEGTQVGHRQVRHGGNRIQRKKIGPHGGPIYLAQRGDGRVDGRARHLEAQHIAHLQTQGLGKALLDADSPNLLGLPASGGDVVVGRQGRAIGNVELSLHQPAGAIVLVILGGDAAPVHRHQPPPDHGIPIEFLNARIAQRLLEGLGLLGHEVDNKTVGRIRRRGTAPAVDQIGAQQDQQHQCQQTHGQRADLHHGIGRARRDLPRGQHQRARCGCLVHAAAQQLNRQPAQTGEHQHRRSEAAHRDQAQLHIAAHRHQKRGKTGHTHSQHTHRRGPQLSHVTADHPQGRNLRQLQNGRQAEGKQQGQTHATAQQDRRPPGRGQTGFHQTGQQN